MLFFYWTQCGGAAKKVLKSQSSGGAGLREVDLVQGAVEDLPSSVGIDLIKFLSSSTVVVFRSESMSFLSSGQYRH